MDKEINVGLNVDVSQTGKSIPELSNNFASLVTALESADIAIKDVEHRSNTLGNALKALAQNTAATTTVQNNAIKASNGFNDAAGSAQKRIEAFNKELLESPQNMLQLIRAEKVAGGSMSSLAGDYDKATIKLREAITKREKLLKSPGTSMIDLARGSAGLSALPAIEKANAAIIKQSAAFYKAEKAVLDYDSVLLDTRANLSKFSGSMNKAMDETIISTKESTQYVALLSNEIKRLNGVTATPGTEEFATNQARIAEFTAALTIQLKEENKTLEAQERLYSSSAGKLAALQGREAHEVSKFLADEVRQEQKAADAKLRIHTKTANSRIALEDSMNARWQKLLNARDAMENRDAQRDIARAQKAAAQKAAMGYTGLGSQRLGTGDTGLLANLSRLGVINPQMAQLSYVLGAVTSSGMLAALAVVGIGTAMAVATKKTVQAAAELQKYQITLQALSTHGWDPTNTGAVASKDLGTATSKGMIEYGVQSMYTMDKVAEGTEKLVGYGIDMRMVNTEMEMLGNLALGDSARLENLAVAYGQVFGQGKARAQEMYQFINAGIPVFDALAKRLTDQNLLAAEEAGDVTKAIAVSTADVMDMTKKGEVSFTIIRDLLKEMTSEGGRYHDLMAQVAGLSFNGQWTVFTNNLNLTMANLGDNLLPALTDILKQINAAFDRNRKEASAKEIVTAYKNTAYMSDKGKATVFDPFSSGSLDTFVTQDKIGRARLAKLYDEGATNYDLGFQLAAGTNARAGTGQEKFIEGNTKQNALIKAITDMTKMNAGGMSDSDKANLRTANVQAFDTLLKESGLTEDNRKDVIAQLFYPMVKGKELQDSSLAGLMEKWRVTDAYDKTGVTVGALTKTKLGGYLDTAITRAFPMVQDPLVVAAVSKTLDSRPTDINKPPVNLDDTGLPGGDRKFELIEYNKALTEQIATMLQLNPLQQQYVAILQMKRKDMEAIGTLNEKGYKEGMSEADANAAEATARNLYKQSQALTVYQDSYKALADFKLRNQIFTDAEIAASAKELESKILLEDSNYEYAGSLIKVASALAEAGTDTTQTLAFFESIKDALTAPEDKKSVVGVMLDQLDELKKMLGGDIDVAQDFADSLKYIADVFGDDAAKGALAYIKELKSEVGGLKSKIPQNIITAVANDTLVRMKVENGTFTEDEAIRATAKTSEVILAEQGLNRENIIAAGGEYARMFQLGMNIDEVIAKGRIAASAVGDDADIAFAQYEAAVKTLKANAATTAAYKEAADDVLRSWASGDIAQSSDTARQAMLEGASLSNRRRYTLETALGSKERVNSLSAGLFWTGSSGENTETAADKLAMLQQTRDSFKTVDGFVQEGKEDEFALAAANVDKYTESLQRAADTSIYLRDSLKDMGMTMLNITLSAASDMMYEFGRATQTSADASDTFEESMRNFGRTVMNQLPGLLISMAIGTMTTSGGTAWPLALGFLAAALGTSFVGGIMGSKEDAEEDSSDSNELQLLQNLQEQFQTMITQFERNILYLATMRQAYKAETQATAIQGFASGDVFPGRTGLAQGVYNEPTFFRFANGGSFTGVMGEAGAEAIMPLQRDANGKLGVVAAGAGGKVNLIINNYADADVSDVQEETGSDGTKQLIVTIEKAMQGAVASGKLDRVMGTRFGSRPIGSRRS